MVMLKTLLLKYQKYDKEGPLKNVDTLDLKTKLRI